MDVDIDFELWPKQEEALTNNAQLTVYGGAAGSGKSHLSRVAAITAALEIPGLQIYLFRRHYRDLLNNHMDGPTGFRALLVKLVEMGICQIVDMEIRFPTLGSIIKLCSCQHEKDVYNFQGPEFHFLIIEETTQFSEKMLRFLFSRVRLPDTLKIPEDMRHRYPRILLPTNPGGIGHGFVRSSFIDNHEPGVPWRQPDSEGGRTCVFIPARLSDNPSINPVEYRAALLGLKRQELIDAMLDGKWDIPLGAMFPECDERKHLLDPIELPPHLLRFRTFDWGAASPFCVQWWVIADSETYKKNGAQIPCKSLIMYREWYGCAPGDPTKGLGLSNRQMVEGILARSPSSEIISATITDQKPFQSGGGLKISDEFWNEGKFPSVLLTAGDNKKGSRIQKWQQLRSRLIGINNIPLIYFFKDCKATWRELTEIQADEDVDEDLNTDMPDHAVDSVGHAVQTWPMVKELQENKPITITNEITFDQALKKIQKKKSYTNGSRW